MNADFRSPGRSAAARRTAFAALALLAAAASGAPATAQVVVGDQRTEGERHQDRAETLRRTAQDRAAAHLGYPSLRADLPPPSAEDYWALSQQIARLGAAVAAMAGSPAAPPGAAPAVPIAPIAPAADAGGLSAVYGPEGPTAKAVGLLLEYRLMVAGNPRLKVGKVVEEPERILAQVVTRDGSVVEEYAVDRKTGGWTAIR